MNPAVGWLSALCHDWHLLGGLGINTNLLDTNLINLGAVISVLVYFANKVGAPLLRDRKEKISGTVCRAEEQYRETLDKLDRARAKVTESRQEAEQWRIQSSLQAQTEREAMLRGGDDDVRREHELMRAAVRFQERITLKRVFQQTWQQLLDRAKHSVSSRLDDDLHAQLINYQIDLFTAADDLVY